VVERNGNFWVDNIPPAPGTNWLTVTATDIKGNVTSNTIYVVQSSVAITIDPITDNLNQPTVNVTGTISVSNYTVWVNGVSVMATNFGWTGTAYFWSAINVPVNGAGCAVLQVVAIPDTAADNYGNGTTPGGGSTNCSLSNPGNPGAPDALCLEINQNKAGAIICDYFCQNWTCQGAQYYNPGNTMSSWWLYTQTADWSDVSGGSLQFNDYETSWDDDGSGAIVDQSETFYQYQWATNGNGTSQYEAYQLAGDACTNISSPVYYNGPTTFPGLHGAMISVNNEITSESYFQQASQSARSHFLFDTTGGRSLPGRRTLHGIPPNAAAIVPPLYWTAYSGGWTDPSMTITNIPPQQVKLFGQPETPDLTVWADLPDGEVIGATPSVTSVAFYLTGPVDADYPPHIYFNVTNDVTDSNTTVIVGQQINLSCSIPGGPAMSNFCWSVPGTTESQFFVSGDPLWTNGYPIPLTATNTNTVSFFWVDAGTNTVTCTALLGGQTNRATTSFKVLRPVPSIVTNMGTVTMTTDVRTDLWLNFGIPNNAAGATFSFTMPAGFSNYSTEWVQVITSLDHIIEITNIGDGVTPHTRQTVGTVLDKQYPATAFNTFSDSPQIPLYYTHIIGAFITNAFKATIMFQPTLNPTPTNWVPIWTITWRCTAVATGFGENPSDWSLTGTNISVLQSADSGTNYPSWSNNSRNFQQYDPPLH